MIRRGSVLDGRVEFGQEDEPVSPAVAAIRDQVATRLAEEQARKEAERAKWAKLNAEAGERIRARKQAEIEALEKPGREMRAEQAQRELARIKSIAEQEFVASGGSLDAFEREWPEIKAEVLRQRAAAAATQAQPIKVRL